MLSKTAANTSTGFFLELDPGNYAPSGRLVTGYREGNLVNQAGTPSKTVRLVGNGVGPFAHPTGRANIYEGGIVVWCYGCGDRPHAYHYAGAGEADLPRILDEFPFFRVWTEEDEREDQAHRLAEDEQWIARYR